MTSRSFRGRRVSFAGGAGVCVMPAAS
jgi:hypothetical protein